MPRPLIVRQHSSVLMPDPLLALITITLFIKGKDITLDEARSILIGMGILFFIVAAGHLMYWLSFHLEIENHHIYIQCCWLHRRSISVSHPAIKVAVMQTSLDERLNKGTLVIDTPEGDMITLSNLANFDELIAHLS